MITKRKPLFSRAFLALIRKIALRIGLSSALLASIAGCPSQNASNQQIPPKFDTSKKSFKTKGVFDINWSNISSDYIRGNYVIVKKDILLSDVSNYVSGVGAVLPSLEYIGGVIAAGTTIEMGKIFAIAAGVDFLLNKTGNQNLKVDIYLPWLPIFGPPYLIVPSASNWDGTALYEELPINSWKQQVNIGIGEEKKFSFEMIQGKTYQINLQTNYGDSDIFASNNMSFTKETAQGKSERSETENDNIEFVAPHSGKNYILVYGFKTSSFNINVNEVWSWWR